MKYPVVVEPGNDTTAWGVIVPGLPGCFAAGDTFEEALDNAREAIELHLDALLEGDGQIPDQVPIEEVLRNKEYRGYIHAVIDVDIERVNVTLPKKVLRALDRRAEVLGLSRSGHIAEMAVGGFVARRDGASKFVTDIVRLPGEQRKKKAAA
ncbi:MAG: type II toxin-antitoxin system HicB family antitoxin [Sinimarinibacterium sp.]|jgi:predicted RNase H-like HicB family nuclease